MRAIVFEGFAERRRRSQVARAWRPSTTESGGPSTSSAGRPSPHYFCRSLDSWRQTAQLSSYCPIGLRRRSFSQQRYRSSREGRCAH
jgi:hypothetical protein